MVGIDDERSFFDDEYRRCLSLPDQALRWNAQRLRECLDDPSHPFWERRRLFAATLEVLLGLELARRTAMDYGCGTGDWGVLMATEGAQVTLLDLSPVALEVARRRARVSGVEDRVSAECRDASNLGCFADGSFDLVFAGAALHHTLKYPGALEELVRVIRPGGTLVLAETYGNNPLLTVARKVRARLAREPQEQGEGVVLSDHDLARLGEHFATLERRPLNLLAMTKRLFRGRYQRWPCRALIAALEQVDRVVLGAIPSLRRHCGEVVVIATK